MVETRKLFEPITDIAVERRDLPFQQFFENQLNRGIGPDGFEARIVGGARQSGAQKAVDFHILPKDDNHAPDWQKLRDDPWYAAVREEMRQKNAELGGEVMRLWERRDDGNLLVSLDPDDDPAIEHEVLLEQRDAMTERMVKALEEEREVELSPEKREELVRQVDELIERAAEQGQEQDPQHGRGPKPSR